MLGKKPRPKPTFEDFEVPSRFEDLQWRKDSGLSWTIYSVNVGPFLLTVKDEPGEVTWNVANGESLTSVSRIELGGPEIEVRRAMMKCFVVVNFLRILKDDFTELEKP